MSPEASSLTKRDFVVAVWEALDCESVGARELEQIQLEVVRRFGVAPADSPAAIARMLADEGAHLRHPEILEYDSTWRQKMLHQCAQTGLDFSSLDEATRSLAFLEDLRVKFLTSGEQQALRDLLETVVEQKEDCLFRAASPVIDVRERDAAREIASWLGVWLRTPELFASWLELRRLSPEFRTKFG